ncbi:MAG: LysR family transcriptional regulator, partial [Myxococcota bacterium]
MARDTPPLAGLDLNLLVTLRALLREVSVTRAAHTLGQRQPTVSRALATLRSAFADELLVRTGRSMSLTPLATSLRVPVERALAAIDRLSAVGGFAPASAVRTFRLALPDLIGPLLVPDLMKAVVAQAPGVDLEMAGSERDAQRALLE